MEVNEKGGAYLSPGFWPIREEKDFTVRWRGKARLGLYSALAGSGGRLSRRGGPTQSRVGGVFLNHGVRIEAMLSIWKGDGSGCEY